MFISFSISFSCSNHRFQANSKRYFPVLPLSIPSLGPASDDAVDRNDSKTYHKSKLLCCKHRADPHIGKPTFNPRTGEDEYKEDCIYALARDFEAPQDMRFSNEAHQMYR